MEMPEMVSKIIAILFISISLSYSQYIKVENGTFKVVNYTLIESILTYRIVDLSTNECIRGGEWDWGAFYEPSYFTDKKGKYLFTIYIKDRVFIREIVEVK